MQRLRRRSPTVPLWLFALALLLRAAMPFLADASAELQGRALGEVCSVYGVSLAAHDSAPHGGATGHAGDHCALGALGALGTPDTPPGAVLPPQAAVAQGAAAGPTERRPDATATWVARRKQGPPGRA